MNTMAWDLGTLLNNALTKITDWGGALVMLLGAVVLIMCVWTFVKNVRSSTPPQERKWALFVIQLIGGGALLTGGWALIETISSGGQKTIEELGTGVWLLAAGLPGM